MLLVANQHLKLTFGNIRSLRMVVLVRRAYCTFLKAHFYEHQLAIISHNLTADTGSGILPLDVFLKDKTCTAGFHCKNI